MALFLTVYKHLSDKKKIHNGVKYDDMYISIVNIHKKMLGNKNINRKHLAHFDNLVKLR